MTGLVGGIWPPQPDDSWPSRGTRRTGDRPAPAGMVAAGRKPVDQQHSSAVLVALPADDDPVHRVSGDAHITLHFLGEADQVTPAERAALADLLRLTASALRPFAVEVAGTGTLGADDAPVLLVQSGPLTRLREALGTEPAVSEVAGRAEQYPHWIPHLTLDDDASSRAVSRVRSFVVGGLGLWLGDHRVEVPLGGQSKTQPVVTDDDAEFERENADSIASIVAGGTSIPRVSDLRSLRLCVRYSHTHPNARWYCVRRAHALGLLTEVPDEWITGSVVHSRGRTVRLTANGSEPVTPVEARDTADEEEVAPLRLTVTPEGARMIYKSAYPKMNRTKVKSWRPR